LAVLHFLASDATPIIENTDKVIYIDNDDIITIERGKSLIIKTIADVEKTSEIRKLEMTLSQLEKKWLSAFYGKRDI
jgi:glucosamine--fructose-6-phosphate aminotransferase (isomerizing)